MSDIRFIMIGVVVITVGFVILGVFGTQYTEITVQTDEFSTCYEYSDGQMAVEIDCQQIMQDKILLFVGIISIISAGIFALVKGVRGTWDQDVKPDEMVGPGGDQDNDDADNKT